MDTFGPDQSPLSLTLDVAADHALHPDGLRVATRVKIAEGTPHPPKLLAWWTCETGRIEPAAREFSLSSEGSAELACVCGFAKGTHVLEVALFSPDGRCWGRSDTSLDVTRSYWEETDVDPESIQVH